MVTKLDGEFFTFTSRELLIIAFALNFLNDNISDSEVLEMLNDNLLDRHLRTVQVDDEYLADLASELFVY